MIECHYHGWGQFHFFNSIPITIPLFSIPIPIPLLTISFNSNSNSGDFNSNSNSGDFKSRQSQFWKWPIDVFLEIDYNYTKKVHVYKIIVINTISLISLVEYNYMASWLIGTWSYINNLVKERHNSTCEACVKLTVVQSPLVNKIWALAVKFAPGQVSL